jgi:hypothetical protein
MIEREPQPFMFNSQKWVYENLVLAATFNCSSVITSFGKLILEIEILY